VKKKYSDPLMFSSALLTTIPIKPSDNGTIGPDDPWDEDEAAGAAAGLRLNASPSQQTSDPVTIVNPVEEAVNSTDTVTEEASGTATTTTPSPLEVEPVIDGIVPDGTTSSTASSAD
jgi:hypothetical protein